VACRHMTLLPGAPGRPTGEAALDPIPALGARTDESAGCGPGPGMWGTSAARYR